MKELIKDTDFSTLSKEIQDNLTDLLTKMNIIRAKYGHPMTVTSGLRTSEDQMRIYREIAEKKKVPFDTKKVPMGSQHLHGCAVDIADGDKKLGMWATHNPEIIQEVGLWMEDFDYTKSWVHFQTKPYGSWRPGHTRFFKP